MNGTKPWYLSRTILASIVTIATAMAGAFGVPVGAIDNGALADTLLQLATALSGAVAILGRVSASDRIG